jgi:hypothetical protein
MIQKTVAILNIRSIPILIAIAFWPMQVFSAAPPDISSEIPGVQLWLLETDESGFPKETFFYQNEEGVEKNEFIEYCNGSRSIYVGSRRSPIRCKSEMISLGNYRIFLGTKGSYLSGIVLVSKKPLPSRVSPVPVTAEESEILKVERISMRERARRIWKSFPELEPGDYSTKYIKAINQKYGNAQYKIPTLSGFIYILSGSLSPDPFEDMVNTAFRATDGRLEKIGDFSGCVEGFRDLDADGTPEVLTRYCGQVDEGLSYNFLSLTPTVRAVLRHSR